METTYKTFSHLVVAVKTWISRRSDPPNVSRDFWMPDQSCLVCYDCDSQFTLFNRRHHCRLCGRVFCGKCTENSVPSPEEGEKIRACNFCYRRSEQGILASVDFEIGVPNLGLNSGSPTALSFTSAQSSVNLTLSSVTLDSVPYSFELYQQSDQDSCHSSSTSCLAEAKSHSLESVNVENHVASGEIGGLVTDGGYSSSEQHRISMNSMYQMDSEAARYSSVNAYRSCSDYEETSNEGNAESRSLSSSPLDHRGFNSQDLEGISIARKEDENYIVDEGEPSSSIYADSGLDPADEPVDFENNGLLWLPPLAEDGEEERDEDLFDDDEEYGNSTGDWGRLRASSSFGSGESRIRDRSNEEQKTAMKNVVDGHFRALVAQLLQVENLLTDPEDDKDSWLEIVTSLSWEAATLLKPDMSKGGGMDPGGYAKVKCLAFGNRRQSAIVKGVICKKNVAHRRMPSKLQNPRIFILGGALEYQRVANHLSSFDTLLQQEMDHLRMAVAKIEAHNPNLVLVEKSVSRFAQEYLLEKDIALVLNLKRPLLERISRCTGSPIVPSIDNLSAHKLGFCEGFRVERFQENLGSAGQEGKKRVKTLMYFEGCPMPLGCTILLRGANGNELKKIKHVLQYGIFAAYHLAMETSFLADEGASLPDLSLNFLLPMGFSDKSKSMDRSISTVLTAVGKYETSQEPQRSNSVPTSDISSYVEPLQSRNKFSSLPSDNACPASSDSLNNYSLTEKGLADSYTADLSTLCSSGDQNETCSVGSRGVVSLTADDIPAEMCNIPILNNSGSLDALDQGMLPKLKTELRVITKSPEGRVDIEESGALQEDQEPFPPSPSDHQSILVSLSSRCIWKGTICERSHMFRIKYYGSFDKPLGRFLRDHIFDQTYKCNSCEMPSEAHVQSYTHRQGTLTISVKNLPEVLLPGEKEGKIWMWHRCLVCPRVDGFPPATRRIVMSDAAWGLSFGKFLELSFSNHAAASRIASCGHSLHRDCLRFYGYGKMVACFRYAAIDVLSVHLPPSQINFSNEKQEWIRKETDKVVDRVDLLFSEALNALSQIAEKRSGAAVKTSESRRKIAELEEILQKEKQEFEESIMQTLNRETSMGQPMIDILEINRLRRQLIFQSYMWDHRLIYAAGPDNQSTLDQLSRSISEPEDKPADNIEKIAEKSAPIRTGKGYNSFDSFLMDEKRNKSFEFPLLLDASDALSNSLHTDRSYEAEDKILPSPSASSFNLSEKWGSPMNTICKTHSEGEFNTKADLSNTLDAAWTGENHTGTLTTKEDIGDLSDSTTEESLLTTFALTEKLNHDHTDDRSEAFYPLPPVPYTKNLEKMEDSVSLLSMPFVSVYRSLNKGFFASPQKLNNPLGNYNPVYVTSFRESELQCGARMLLPVGVNDTVIPVYDDEPTSIIAYALVSPDYHSQLSDDMEKPKESTESLFSSFSESLNFQSFHSTDDSMSESHRSLGSFDESFMSISGSRSLDPLSYTKALHARVSFGDDGPVGKVKFSVTCYYAQRFEALRRICCPSELDFVRSLSRCKKWKAEGGKTNVFFAKTLDDRFVVKQVTKTELESFIKFAPEYFKYLSESINTGSPTCLAKILGMYQVTSKHLRGGRDIKMDVLIMENLMYKRSVTRIYDLKGSHRSRYAPDVGGKDKVLLDQNLIDTMRTAPIFLETKPKRLLERAVWNDTAFLASVDVMDYSLLVGLDEENHELVLGIIDFMRQYTWDKHLETWVKTSGILGGPKNTAPTVISPKQYKKRFRKAMTTYFLMVPDQWFPSAMVRSHSHSDLGEENNSLGIGTPGE